MFQKIDDVSRDWSNFTLVLPAVSMGNVGQLATDVLIQSLSSTLIGYLNTSTVLPVVGCDPYSLQQSNQLATAIQVYESSSQQLIIVQQRAPCIKGLTYQFVGELIDWIKECRFKHVVLLTSMSAHERLDCQLFGPQTRYLISPAGRVIRNVPESTAWIELEKRPTEWCTAGSDSVFIPGGGMTRKFFNKCCEENLAVTVLLVFVAEGNNISDALTLASYSNHYLQLVPIIDSKDQWKIPVSWKLMFGTVTDRSLFY